MYPYSKIAGGTLTATAATAQDIPLSSMNPPDFFIMKNITQWGSGAAADKDIEWWWERSMAQDTAKGTHQTLTTNGLTSVRLLTGGISTYSTSNPPTFAALATTAITGNAGTFVVSMANTGSIAVGDWVRLYATTGELQIAGYAFQVTAVTANTSITLGYMASSGITFAAAATAGQVIKFIPNKMFPRWNFVANITKATQAVVYFTGKNDFTPGEIVSFRVSDSFGMDELNNKAVRVLSVTNSATVSSITVDLDTSGFTTFAFPTSAAAVAGVSPAVVVPSSSGVVPFNGSATVPQQPPGTNLQDAADNRNVYYVHLGASIFTNSLTNDIWMWEAFKYDQYNGL